MSKETYTARAMLYYEQSCGCNATQIYSVYDHTGNNVKRFDTYAEAEIAARAKMAEMCADNWGVT